MPTWLVRRWLGGLRGWLGDDPDRAVTAGIAAATLARLVYVVYLGDDLGGPDSSTYDQAGRDLADHGLLSADVGGLPFWAPGYPMLVALHYAVFGHHPLAVALTQTVMIAGLTWLTYRLALRVVGQPAALVTGLGMSASLAWLALPHPLMYEPWLALFLLATVVLLLRFDDDGGLRLVAAAGLSLGLGAAFQNKVLSLVPLVAVWVLLVGRERRSLARRVGAAAVLLAGALTVVAPLVARNQAVYDEPILIATKNGANLLYGTNRDADGSIANQPVDDIPWCPGVSVFDQRDYLRTDRELFACALREVREHPGHQLRILPNKFARLWLTYVGPWEPPGNWRHHFDVRDLLPGEVRETRWFRPADLALSTAWVVAGVTLAAAGGVLLARRLPGRVATIVLLPIGWLAATHLATFGDPRFRIPVLPLVWLLQASALVALAGRLIGGSRAPRGTAHGSPNGATGRY